jgi:hypothetical protein
MASEAPSNPGTGPHSYIPSGAVMRECTPRAIIVGTLLGMVRVRTGAGVGWGFTCHRV